jgi:hypothetical protein
MSSEAPIELLDSSDDEPSQQQDGGDKNRKFSKWAQSLMQLNEQRQKKRKMSQSNAAAVGPANAHTSSVETPSKPAAANRQQEDRTTTSVVPKKVKRRAFLETVSTVPNSKPAFTPHDAGSAAATTITTASRAVTTSEDADKALTGPSSKTSPSKPTADEAVHDSDDNGIMESANNGPADTAIEYLDSDGDEDDFINSIIAGPKIHNYHIDPPKPLKFMKHHCWSCHEWIEHPATLESTAKIDPQTKEAMYCCYLTHEHPVLQVPVCVVCSENLENLAAPSPPTSPSHQTQEKDQDTPAAASDGAKDAPPEEDNDNLDICCACGQPEPDDSKTIHFVCDNKSCSRIFCHHCIAQAHGNVAEVQAMIRGNPNEQWQCCVCAPPDFLKQLQGYMSRLQSEAEAMAAAADDESFSKKPTQKGLDDLISYLQLVEDKKEECDLQLDRIEEDLDDIRRDCEQDEELMAWSAEDLELHIQQSQDEHRKGYEHQRRRLEDTIVTIEDILSSVYGIESRRVYQAIQGSENISGIQKALKDDDDDPAWKRAADKAIARLEKEPFKRKPEQNGFFNPDDPRYRLEIPEEVEDLGDLNSSDVDDAKQGSDSEDSYKEFRAGWRNSRYLVSQEAIDAAMAEEEKRFRKRSIKTTACNRNEEKQDRRDWAKALKPVKRKSTKRGGKRSEKSATTTNKTTSSSARSQKTSASDVQFDSDSSDEEPSSYGQGGTSSSNNLSSFVLCQQPKIVVSSHFDQHLKKHQREGVEFMYKSTFADLGDDKAEIGGCVLAHSMGLGKVRHFYTKKVVERRQF